MDTHRAERISETIREELTEIILFEMSDPRIGAVDITEVLISPDMRHASIRLHLGGSTDVRRQTLAALDGARGYLRRQLAGRLRMYRVPELHFEPDLEIGSAERLEQLLRRVRKTRPREASAGTDEIIE